MWLKEQQQMNGGLLGLGKEWEYEVSIYAGQGIIFNVGPYYQR